MVAKLRGLGTFKKKKKQIDMSGNDMGLKCPRFCNTLIINIQNCSNLQNWRIISFALHLKNI